MQPVFDKIGRGPLNKHSHKNLWQNCLLNRNQKN